MFGDDDSSETRTDDRRDVDVERLANEAEGPSVTARRLRGDETYYPDSRPYLIDGLQPQHLILLTTSGWVFRTEGLENEYCSTFTELNATRSEGGVGICTDSGLLVVVGSAFCEVAYSNIVGMLAAGGTVELHTTGSKGYIMNVARSADVHETTLALGYLRRKVRAAASEKPNLAGSQGEGHGD